MQFSFFPIPLHSNTRIRPTFLLVAAFVLLGAVILLSRKPVPAAVRWIQNLRSQASVHYLESLSVNRHCSKPIDPARILRFHQLFRPLHPHGNRVDGVRRVFVALNLFNNEQVLPDLLLQLLWLVEFLGTDRVFFSIYESGSTDKTRKFLAVFQQVLESQAIAHHVVVDGSLVRNPTEHRIDYLAAIRNEAMLPLYDSEPHAYDRVLFLNDVFMCAHDMVELLYQSVRNQADMTCGLDYDYTEAGGLGFYDTWVMRDRLGAMVEKRPLPANILDEESNQRLKNGLPFVASCCWNGAAVLNANAFHHQRLEEGITPVRFRHELSSTLEPTDAGYQELSDLHPGEPLYKTCSSSEINTLCMDFARAGFHRVLVVPRVKVAYDWQTYNLLHRDLYLVEKELRNDEDALVEFSEKPVMGLMCHPMDKVGGRDPDGPLGWVKV